jgi:hypothetical protein
MTLLFVIIVYLCNYNNIPFMVQLITKYFKVCMVLISADQSLWGREKYCWMIGEWMVMMNDTDLSFIVGLPHC